MKRTVLMCAAVLVAALVAAPALGSTPASAATARHHPPRSAGQRIVSIARRYVGHARYREGGNTPKRGFDCSGYTQYVFHRAGVARLPHNAEAQRHARHMHREHAGRARPGDLVFYLSGHHAYHVAIYAGHHEQYSAATPKDGIRHQRIWSSHVEYRTDWH
ncbi:C40 family peptidase [Jatrophihabitans endophyticus]|uniref:C40 family peptidase n=1 Tax=Jatrophihabitans endophyticus TaxID=1206085 RepID=UPI001A023CFE|nr:C40 family peptidase [Jatrophihabitans endophyticus]MBE7186813.1 C40 family peptidase [Jatrophihabitans endophyticus]